MKDKIQRILDELETKKRRFITAFNRAHQEAQEAEYKDDEVMALEVMYECDARIEVIEGIIQLVRQINEEN